MITAFNHITLAVKDIEKYSTLYWDWAGISENPNLNIDFILKHKNKKFDWNDISKNPVITMRDIENNILYLLF